MVAVPVLLGLGTAAVFGAAPALHVSRASASDALRDGRSGTGGRRAARVDPLVARRAD